MKPAKAPFNNVRLMTPSAQKAGSGTNSLIRVPGVSANWTMVLALLLLLSTPLIGGAQSYSIAWYKVAGGGGTSTGDVYSVSGTIGQHDAGGPLVGGNFSLAGGFWSLLAVQTPSAPTLRIVLTSTNTAIVCWPSPSSGFHLQMNTDLASASWTAPVETVQDNGTTKYIIVSPPAGKRFYRLNYP